MAGDHPPELRKHPLHRIIPAHAGNSRNVWQPGHRVTDHPRACVELPSAWVGLPSGAGSADHPRACGELAPGGVSGDRITGSSPRMRGTRANHLVWSEWSRIIPAHAGNSCARRKNRSHASDHPRACGELDGLRCDAVKAAGSSPRMRGTRPKNSVTASLIRIIPAHAGNSSER